MEYARMKKLWLSLIVALAAWSSPASAQQADVMVAVNRFVDGYNRSDAKVLTAACASCSIFSAR
jgi:hypothetical protein